MNYTRGGRPLVSSPGNILIVEDLNMEGFTGKVFSKAGKVPKSYFIIKNGKKVTISKEDYERINAERLGSKNEDSCKNQAEPPKGE